MTRKLGGYDVGYGKPPQDSRFKKGRSGNPTGRPKGTRNLETMLERAFQEKVIVTERGKSKKMTKIEVAIRQQMNKAAAGDPKALMLVTALMKGAECARPDEKGVFILQVTEDEANL